MPSLSETMPATEVTLASVRSKLDGTINVAGPLTDAQLGARALATQATLASVLAKLSADPATQTTLELIRVLLTGTLAVSGPLTDAQLNARGLATQTTLAAVLAKLTADPATQTTLAAVLAKLSADPATQTTLEAIRLLLSGGTAKVVAAPSVDQDPIFDNAAALKVTTGASAPVFTPAAGCKFARFDATVDTFIRTDDAAAGDAAGSTRILAGVPETIPVTPGLAVRAYSATAGVLRITPLKVR